MSNVIVLRAQIAALEFMYRFERRCDGARRILDLIASKKDALSLAESIARVA